MLLLANYTLTNWLTRGAMAEFLAAMLVPWVLLMFIRWLSLKTSLYAALFLGLVTGLLFISHSVVAYYLVLMLCVSTVFFVLAKKKAALSCINISSVAMGVLGFLMVAGHYLLIMSVFQKDYDMARIIPPQYLPENQIRPLFQYFYDIYWQWGDRWNAFTVQLDVPVMVLFAVGVSRFAVNRVVSDKVKGSGLVLDNKILALILVLVISLLLQTHLAKLFYAVFPGAAYLQFPWRLLGIITPCLIAVSLFFWQIVFSYRLRNLAVLCCLAFMVYLSGAFKPVKYEALSPVSMSDGASIDRLVFSAFGEYVPKKVGTSASYNTDDLNGDKKTAGCSLVEMVGSRAVIGEKLTKKYIIDCKNRTVYALPLFASPLHRLVVSSPGVDGVVRQACSKSDLYPGLCTLEFKGPGEYQVMVEMPTFGRWYKGLYEVVTGGVSQ